MKTDLKLFDVVALQRAVPEKGLEPGQVGTVVEELSNGAVEVEFSDDEGLAYAFAALGPGDLLKLLYVPVRPGSAMA